MLAIGTLPAGPRVEDGQYLIRFVDPVDGAETDYYQNAGQIIVPPTQAAHDGLNPLGWGGASGANLTVSGDAVFIGVYEPSDGWSHLEITVNSITGLTTNLLMTKSDTSELSVDWGDGSAIVKSSASGNITLSRTYAAAGNYCVRVKITSGTGKWTPGNGTSTTPIFGNGAVWRLKRAILNADVVAIQAYGMAEQNGVDYIISPYTVSVGVNGIIGAASASVICLPVVQTIASSGISNAYAVKSLSLPSLVSAQVGAAVNTYSADVVSLPSLQTISTDGLRGIFSLDELSLPAITAIGNSGLRACFSLRVLHLGPNLLTIAADAFSANISMETYIFDSAVPPTLAATSAFTTIPADCKIRVPAASLAAYQAATNWSAYAAYMEGY